MTAMTFGSLFAGVGGFDLAFEVAGWTPAWQVENDPACQKILKRYWPHVPLHSDIKEVSGDDLGQVEVVVGGFPCQDISVAGRRAGLDGARSGLWWQYHRVLGELRPQWCVIENVAGLLSSGCKPACPGGCVKTHGGDMGAILWALGDLGYGFAYRVLDAQGFGVPQRRRRVFIVGCLGDAGSAAEVLLEPESGGGDLATGGEAGQEVAGTLGGGSGSRGWSPDTDRMTFVPVPYRASQFGQYEDGVGPLTARYAKDGKEGLVAYQCHGTNVGRMGTLRSGNGGVTGGVPFVAAFSENQRAEVLEHEYVRSISSGGGKPGAGYPAVREGMAVRRLTPRECERLQGFPDDWTDGQPDSKRYKQMGNAVAVPVVQWIAERMAMVMERRVAA